MMLGIQTKKNLFDPIFYYGSDTTFTDYLEVVLIVFLRSRVNFRPIFFSFFFCFRNVVPKPFAHQFMLRGETYPRVPSTTRSILRGVGRWLGRHGRHSIPRYYITIFWSPKANVFACNWGQSNLYFIFTVL